MLVSKTVSIDVKCLMEIEKLVENREFDSISEFVQKAVEEKFESYNGGI